MSSAEVTYARARSRRARDAKAAKAKRQKLMLIGGGLLFVVLLVVQVPRTLKMLNPPEATPAPAEVAPAPVAPSAQTPPARRADEARLRAFLAQFSVKDPFVQQPFRAETTIPVRAAAAGQIDPFQQGRGIAAPPAAKPDPAAPSTPSGGPSGWTIVLASIPVGSNKAVAEATAAKARSRGLGGVGVLHSSDYSTLRPGYHVVFTKIYPTRAAAERALTQARANGYPSAYPRRVGR